MGRFLQSPFPGRRQRAPFDGAKAGVGMLPQLVKIGKAISQRSSRELQTT